MHSSKRFKVLFFILLMNHVIASFFIVQSLLMLPITFILLFYNRTLDMRLESLEAAHDTKIKELVSAENSTRKCVSKLTDQIKLLVKKMTSYENSTGKLNRKLHNSISGGFSVDNK